MLQGLLRLLSCNKQTLLQCRGVHKVEAIGYLEIPIAGHQPVNAFIKVACKDLSARHLVYAF